MKKLVMLMIAFCGVNSMNGMISKLYRSMSFYTNNVIKNTGNLVKNWYVPKTQQMPTASTLLMKNDGFTPTATATAYETLGLNTWYKDNEDIRPLLIALGIDWRKNNEEILSLLIAQGSQTAKYLHAVIRHRATIASGFDGNTDPIEKIKHADIKIKKLTAEDPLGNAKEIKEWLYKKNYVEKLNFQGYALQPSEE